MLVKTHWLFADLLVYSAVALYTRIKVSLSPCLQQKEKDDVDPKTGLARAQAEVEETGRNWFGKAKRSAGHTKDAAGHNLNKGKGWVEDKASSAKVCGCPVEL